MEHCHHLGSWRVALSSDYWHGFDNHHREIHDYRVMLSWHCRNIEIYSWPLHDHGSVSLCFIVHCNPLKLKPDTCCKKVDTTPAGQRCPFWQNGKQGRRPVIDWTWLVSGFRSLSGFIKLFYRPRVSSRLKLPFGNCNCLLAKRDPLSGSSVKLVLLCSQSEFSVQVMW